MPSTGTSKSYKLVVSHTGLLSRGIPFDTLTEGETHQHRHVFWTHYSLLTAMLFLSYRPTDRHTHTHHSFSHTQANTQPLVYHLELQSDGFNSSRRRCTKYTLIAHEHAQHTIARISTAPTSTAATTQPIFRTCEGQAHGFV